MRLLSARLSGLQGLYINSMQTDVFIDFTKCKHRIIYLVGPNGSGKSTLMSVLQPLPDAPSMYINRREGQKELIYDNNGTIYDILIRYPVYANGERATTKAFIKEINPGSEPVELNANGTVGSFKEIVYSRFNLDPNFIALSYLSVEDRGLVEKKPSDRKKFVANLLESVEVYNDIYKTLVKRSSVFKSMINSITAKIDSVGDYEKLMIDKASADNRILILEQQKSSLEQAIAASKATIDLIDPNNEIRNLYSELVDEYNSIDKNLSVLYQNIGSLDVNNLEEATSSYVELNNSIFELEKQVDYVQERVRDILSDREEDARLIFIKTSKYNNLKSESTIDELYGVIIEYRKKIFEYEKMFKTIGIKPGSITKDEYILGLNILEDLRTNILNVRSYSSNSDIQMACLGLTGKVNIAEMISNVSDTVDTLNKKLNASREELNYYHGLMNRTEILDNRPKECNIDGCSFIKDALEALSKDPQSNIDRLSIEIDSIQTEIIKKNEELKTLQGALKAYNDLRIVVRSFMNSKGVLEKLPIDSKMFNIEYLVSIIQSGDQMNGIAKLYEYIDYANMIELYSLDSSKLKDLENDMKTMKAQKEIIDQLQEEITNLQKEVADIDKKVEEAGHKVNELQKEIISKKERLSIIDKAISTFKNIDQYEVKKKDIAGKIKTVSGNIDKISKEVDSINKSQSILTGTIQELNPLKQMRDNINYSLVKLQEYQQELSVYNQKYNTIELIKKYSSPTKGGIQTIFMQLYMDKTLSLANELLSLVFGGKLELMPYVINENEFKIPTKSNITNIIVDDVSNCSTSEKSMIAMVMSFALAFHGSPLYNIVRLDEIDGGLDQQNKSMFPVVCRNMVEMLNIEQCFVISHSSESDLSDIDIISLYQDNRRFNGNVIFSL